MEKGRAFPASGLSTEACPDAMLGLMTQAHRPTNDSDLLETEPLRAAVEEAREAVRRGEVIPHERVREWLLELAQGRNTALPFNDVRSGFQKR
ncbi:hypothetical protein [Azospirillum sp. SYSU D00513]|uniref:hypothetical protein n=1 Tax=Azospirillum sp. SYSU D00513 TaxID=2812561 RepID=UPI001A9697FA|nr:hypothetical protein [Azospirillum sp. SYSU D00513]